MHVVYWGCKLTAETEVGGTVSGLRTDPETTAVMANSSVNFNILIQLFYRIVMNRKAVAARTERKKDRTINHYIDRERGTASFSGYFPNEK